MACLPYLSLENSQGTSVETCASGYCYYQNVVGALDDDNVPIH